MLSGGNRSLFNELSNAADDDRMEKGVLWRRLARAWRLWKRLAIALRDRRLLVLKVLQCRQLVCL